MYTRSVRTVPAVADVVRNASARPATVWSVVAPTACVPNKEVGGGAAAFSTSPATAADAVRFPAASRATAVSVCVPFAAGAVSQLIEYGAAVSSGPSGLPSSWNCTPATPTLSDAPAARETVPDTVAPAAGAGIGTDGGEGSGLGAAGRPAVGAPPRVPW